MTELSADILKIIPPEYFAYCYCNPRIVLLNRRFTSCEDCVGTTWKFSELAEHKGYFGKNIRKVYWQKIGFFRVKCGILGLKVRNVDEFLTKNNGRLDS